MRMTSLLALAALLTGFTANAFAGEMDDKVEGLRKQLAEIRYTMNDDDAQVDALNKLMPQADALQAAYPGKAEPLIVEAAILATKAEIVNGPSILGDARRALNLASEAEKISPGVLEGAAADILGGLYHGAPPWPISFGDDSKAAKWFARARAAGPDNLNVAYYYARFLHEKDRDGEARAVIADAVAKLQAHPADAVRAGRLAAFDKLSAKIDD